MTVPPEPQRDEIRRLKTNDFSLSSLHLRAEGRSSGLHHEQREPQLWQPEELSVVATTTVRCSEMAPFLAPQLVVIAFVWTNVSVFQTTTIAQATTEAPVTSTTETPKEVEQVGNAYVGPIHWRSIGKFF